MKVQKDYLGMFDVLKGILMLLIVLIHHMSFVEGGLLQAAGVQKSIGIFDWSAVVIALFFLISGYQFRPAKNIKEYAVRQAKMLLLPYGTAIFVSAVLRGIALGLANGQFDIRDISTLVFGGIYGSIQNVEVLGVWTSTVVALWFLPTTFLSGFIFQLLWRTRKRWIAIAAIWGLTILAVSFPSAYEVQLPFFCVQSCAVLGFMEVGRLLKEKKLLYQKLSPVFVVLASAAFVLCHLFSEANVASNVWNWWMLDYLTACAFSVVVLKLYIWSGVGCMKYVGIPEYIGTYSLLFFCVHGVELLAVPWGESLGNCILSFDGIVRLPLWLIAAGIYVIRVIYTFWGCKLLNSLMKCKYRKNKKVG